MVCNLHSLHSNTASTYSRRFSSNVNLLLFNTFTHSHTRSIVIFVLPTATSWLPIGPPTSWLTKRVRWFNCWCAASTWPQTECAMPILVAEYSDSLCDLNISLSLSPRLTNNRLDFSRLFVCLSSLCVCALAAAFALASELISLLNSLS